MEPSGPAPGQSSLECAGAAVLGAVVRRFRDSAAEDAVQEALLAAAVQWPQEGVPDNPRGWLIQVASRRMTDHLRIVLARRRREAFVALQVPPDAHLAPRPTARTGRSRTTLSSRSSCALIPP